MNQRKRAAELVRQLREASGTDPLARTAIEMIKVHKEMLTESLVELRGEELFRVQGAASAFSKLHRDLTTTPPAQGVGNGG